MQGKHEYQPELFSQIDYEHLIPKGHLLRRIDRVLDLSFLPILTKPLYADKMGRPSIDPIVFVRMTLLGYLYNVDSDRQLCEEVGYNLAYRWFCRLSLKDSVPDHSSLTKIRDRLGEEVYRRIFLTVVEQCREKGLVKAERVMTDGSMFKANASLYKMVERESRDDDDKDDPPSCGSSGVGIEGSKDGLSNKDLRKNSLVGKKLTNATHVSATDPDATLSGKHGEYKALNYKTHHMIDADSRVVFDCHLTTGAVSEVKVVVDRFEAVKAELGIEPKELIADRGYGSGENLIALKERGIKSNIPLWSTRVDYMFRKENPNFSFNAEKLEMILGPQLDKRIGSIV